MPRSRLPVCAACCSPDKAWSQLQAGIMVVHTSKAAKCLTRHRATGRVGAGWDRGALPTPSVTLLCRAGN